MSTQDLAVAVKIGSVSSLLAVTWLLAIFRLRPRYFLRHFPAEIRAVVPPTSARERRAAWMVGVPYLLVLLAFPVWAAIAVDGLHHGDASFAKLWSAAFVAWSLPNLMDWLIVDELVLGIACAVRPRWLILPGAEQVPLRVDHAQHARGFVKGSVGGAIFAALVSAAVVALRSLQ